MVLAEVNDDGTELLCNKTSPFAMCNKSHLCVCVCVDKLIATITTTTITAIISILCLMESPLVTNVKRGDEKKSVRDMPIEPT